MSECILDLDDILDHYLAKWPDRYGRKAAPIREVSWADVELKPAQDARYDLRQQNLDSSRLVLNHRYTNKTRLQQTFRVQTQRSARRSLSLALHTGVQMGGGSELCFRPPSAAQEPGFKADLVRFPRLRGSALQEEVRWSVDADVAVLPGRIASVQTHLKEMRYEGSFNQRVKISGHVTVNFKDAGNKYLRSKRIPITDLCYEVLVPASPNSRYVVYMKENHVEFNVRGKCCYQINVDKEVSVREEIYREE